MDNEIQLDLPGLNEPCLTIPQIAMVFGIAPSKIRRAIARGDLKPFTIGTSRALLRPSDIVRLIEANRVTTKPKPKLTR